MPTTHGRQVRVTLKGLIIDFQASADYRGLSDATRRSYAMYLERIEQRFGSAPLGVFNDPRIRRDILAWRDSMADRPRTADYVMQVLGRLLSWGIDRGYLAANHIHRIGKLHSADRSEIVWTEADIQAFLGTAPGPLQLALVLALWTGQRQGDLL